jgi:hypothetical protein
MIELLFASESVVISHSRVWDKLKAQRDEFLCLEMAKKCIFFLSTIIPLGSHIYIFILGFRLK